MGDDLKARTANTSRVHDWSKNLRMLGKSQVTENFTATMDNAIARLEEETGNKLGAPRIRCS